MRTRSSVLLQRTRRHRGRPVKRKAGIPRRRHRHGHPREDVGEDGGVGVRFRVGIVECELNVPCNAMFNASSLTHVKYFLLVRLCGDPVRISLAPEN